MNILDIIRGQHKPPEDAIETDYSPALLKYFLITCESHEYGGPTEKMSAKSLACLTKAFCSSDQLPGEEQSGYERHDTFGVVSTQIGKHKHVTVLDCDSTDAVLAAAHWCYPQHKMPASREQPRPLLADYRPSRNYRRHHLRYAPNPRSRQRIHTHEQRAEKHPHPRHTQTKWRQIQNHHHTQVQG